MRKIYDEYLYVPEQGEGVVREKVFFSRLVLSIACMVVCMIAMGYNAYAYFTSNIESTANVLQASTYSTPVTTITLIPAENGSAAAEAETPYKYTLAPGQYDFTLQKEGSARTGYCRIDVTQGDSIKSFYTEQIGVINEAGEEVLTRTVRITVEKATVVQFIGCWGTYSGSNGDPLVQEKDMILIKNDGTAGSTQWATAQPANIAPVQESGSETNQEGGSGSTPQTQQLGTQENSQQPVQSETPIVPGTPNVESEEQKEEGSEKTDTDNSGEQNNSETEKQE